MFLVDSNVLLDIVKKDPRWGAWSEKSLAQAVDSGPIAINQLIYAEVSVAYERCEQLDSILGAFDVAKLSLPWEAAFLAGRAFLKYRRRGGNKTSPLPDFYIGAHAMLADLTLLTRDGRRYRGYFPELRLICPDSGS
ncbi:MAG: type II toxin-antitoxin system VapC family toxin [Gammaproteobacteria bacterium]